MEASRKAANRGSNATHAMMPKPNFGNDKNSKTPLISDIKMALLAELAGLGLSDRIVFFIFIYF